MPLHNLPQLTPVAVIQPLWLVASRPVSLTSCEGGCCPANSRTDHQNIPVAIPAGRSQANLRPYCWAQHIDPYPSLIFGT